MEKLIVGFAGEIASGKGEGTGIVRARYPGTPSFRFSDPLREFWASWRTHLLGAYGVTLPEGAQTPDLQEMSRQIRAIFGEDVLERAIVSRAKRSASSSPIVVIEGIRRLVDISVLINEPNFRLIYVEADPAVRWQRFVWRNEKPGDAARTFEEFLELGKAEAEREIRLLRDRAHLIVDNSGERWSLERKVSAAIAEWVPPRLSEGSLLAVTLSAGAALVKKYRGHRLYHIRRVGGGDWEVVPQNYATGTLDGWRGGEIALINEWLKEERGFRAFMTLDERNAFTDPVLDREGERFVLRFGNYVISLLA